MALVHKYRPKLFKNFQGNHDIVKVIKALLKKNKNALPNMLFEGPYGCGKTTLAYIIANSIFDGELEGNFYEFNGSAKRGIDVIRDEIEPLASRKNKHYRKIIFLDEMDKLTADAQDGLRNLIEKYQNNAMFIMTCNYIYKVQGALKSRLKQFTFKPLDDESIATGIYNVAQNEDIEITEEQLISIIERAKGDLRKALDLLEGVAVGEDVTELNEHLSDLDFNEFIGISCNINPNMIRDRLYKEVIIDKKLYNNIPVFAECDYRIALGSNPILQIQWLYYEIIKNIGE